MLAGVGIIDNTENVSGVGDLSHFFQGTSRGPPGKDLANGCKMGLFSP